MQHANGTNSGNPAPDTIVHCRVRSRAVGERDRAHGSEKASGCLLRDRIRPARRSRIKLSPPAGSSLAHLRQMHLAIGPYRADPPQDVLNL
jgi:hypothetical protein